MILKIYEQLLKHFGYQHWWPTIGNENPKFEIIVGAILTQQTSWKNVEKTIENLKNNNLLEPKRLHELPIKELERIIRPCGFFKLKARRLRSFLEFLIENYNGNLEEIFNNPINKLRKDLLSVHGIGYETCDSILLYAERSRYLSLMPTLLGCAKGIRL